MRTVCNGSNGFYPLYLPSREGEKEGEREGERKDDRRREVAIPRCSRCRAYPQKLKRQHTAAHGSTRKYTAFPMSRISVRKPLTPSAFRSRSEATSCGSKYGGQ